MRHSQRVIRWISWATPVVLLACGNGKTPCVPASNCMVASVAGDFSCTMTPAPDGTACGDIKGPCGAPTCAKGVCKQQNVGASCVTPEGNCTLATGTCDSAGVCNSSPKPAGAACTADGGGCLSDQGNCDGNGTCTPNLKPVGSLCAGSCALSACDAQGACIAPATCNVHPSSCPAGSGCNVGAGDCVSGICTSDGTCRPGLAQAGAPCSGESGCRYEGTCDGKGKCGGKPREAGMPCGYQGPCAAPECDGQGGCKVVPYASGTPCPTKLGACFLANGACDGSGKCVPSQLPAGAKCTFDNTWTDKYGGNVWQNGNPCLEGACSPSGVCQPKALVGAVCGKDDPCLVGGTCDASGLCSGSVQVGASCGGAPGKCKAMRCQADGSCQPAPLTGSACDTGDPCLTQGKCDASGACVGTVAVGASCGDSPEACHVRTCGKSGACETVVAVGATCKPLNPCRSGTCASDGTCQAGAVLPGAPCPTGDPCKSGTCDDTGDCKMLIQTGKKIPVDSNGNTCTCLADGICQKQCSKGEACGGLCGGPGTCDATGHCLTPAVAGQVCPDWVAFGTSACADSCTCNGKGGIDVALHPWGSACVSGSTCPPGGVCQGGWCSSLPAESWVCDDGNLCTQDSCASGTCKHKPVEWVTKCGGAGCSPSECAAGACKAGATNSLCVSDCDMNCSMLEDRPCRSCKADYAADGCPCLCSPTPDGTSCGVGLVCKTGQCILK